MDWKEREGKVFMNTGHRRLGITLVRGRGALVWDDAGKEYLDFIAGWAVNNLGHCHPAVVEAVTRQVQTLILGSNDVFTTPAIELAEMLARHTGLDRVYIANSGAEANEGAIKLARKYGKLHLNGAYEVISALNSFHGRTLALVAATGNPHYQETYVPLPEGFVNVAYDDVDAIRAATTARTCAVLLEPIQGEGGVIVPGDGYLPEVRRWCDERGILLMLDEVQTGMGRTGSLFAFQSSGIVPDVLTLGKGLGGGVPVSAFLARERAAVFGPGDHGTTFGGNALCSAAACAVLSWMVEHDVPGNALRVGRYLMESLEALKARHEVIVEVRGRGLLVAVAFERDVAREVVLACRDGGLLLNPVRPNAIRFMPPLIITRSDVDRAMDVLETALNTVAAAVTPA